MMTDSEYNLIKELGLAEGPRVFTERQVIGGILVGLPQRFVDLVYTDNTFVYHVELNDNGLACLRAKEQAEADNTKEENAKGEKQYWFICYRENRIDSPTNCMIDESPWEFAANYRERYSSEDRIVNAVVLWAQPATKEDYEKFKDRF